MKHDDDFKETLNLFFSYWKQECEDIKMTDISRNDRYSIFLKFNIDRTRLHLQAIKKKFKFTWKDFMRIRLMSLNLSTSLAVAENNRHKNNRKFFGKFVDHLNDINLPNPVKKRNN